MRRIDEGPEHLTAEYRTPDDIRRLFERYRTALSDPLPRLDPSVGSSGRKTQRGLQRSWAGRSARPRWRPAEATRPPARVC